MCCSAVKSFAYFGAKGEISFSFFKSSHAMCLIPSPTERYVETGLDWVVRGSLTKPLRSFNFLEVKIHIFKLTKQQPVHLKVSFK